MRQKILATNEIKAYVKEELSKSPYATLLSEKLEEQYYFINKFNYPGEYIFSDKYGYHKIGIGDRGEKYPDENPIDLDNLCYSIYWGLSTSISFSIPYEERCQWVVWYVGY